VTRSEAIANGFFVNRWWTLAKQKRRSMQQFIRERHLKTHAKKCEVCGFTGFVVVHHKVPISEGGGNEESNLIVLCEVCHNLAHGKKTKNYLDPTRKYWKLSNG
jgi:5-methylcytosine-specific restriction endonuclease McrA